MSQDRCEVANRGSCGDSSLRVPPIVRDVVRTLGMPLPARERSRFGHDFSNVRVHADADAAASARAVRARAYALGEHVVFGANEFAPHTQRGGALLAHELGHVAEQRAGAPVEIARWPDDDPDKVHRGSKGPENDMEGKPRSEADRNRESVHRKYYLAPKVDNEKIMIDAIPDMLLSALTSPRTIDVHINDADIKSIEWSLIAPAGNVLASDTTTPGAADATSKPFRLTSTQIGGVAGRYHLRCNGVGADGMTRLYGVRDFNMVTRDLATGRGTKGKRGRLTFTDYTAYPGYAKVSMDFFPSDDSPACDKVMFVQAGQSLSPGGGNLLAMTSKSMDARKSGAHWSIDQFEGVRSPFYSMKNDIRGNQLVERPQQGASGRGGPEPLAAGLKDAPDAADDRVVRFESCAMCRTEGLDQFYGCATWGFSGTSGGKPLLMPRTFSDDPSPEFLGATGAWKNWFRESAKEKAQP